MFYGSQTGTAEEFATRLAKEASRYTLKAMVADPEEYDMVNKWYFSSIESLAPNKLILHIINIIHRIYFDLYAIIFCFAYYIKYVTVVDYFLFFFK